MPDAHRPARRRSRAVVRARRARGAPVERARALRPAAPAALRRRAVDLAARRQGAPGRHPQPVGRPRALHRARRRASWRGCCCRSRSPSRSPWARSSRRRMPWPPPPWPAGSGCPAGSRRSSRASRCSTTPPPSSPCAPPSPPPACSWPTGSAAAGDEAPEVTVVVGRARPRSSPRSAASPSACVAYFVIGAAAQAPHRGAGRHGAVVRRPVPRLRARRAGRAPPGSSPWSPPGSCSPTGRPSIQTAPSRLSERINWSSITFVLENAVFLLIGLQIAALLDDVVNDDELSLGRTLLVGLAVLVTCLVLRPVWMIPFTLLRRRGAPSRRRPARPAARRPRRLVGRDARRGHPRRRPDPSRGDPAAGPARRHRPGRHRRHPAAAGLDPAVRSPAPSTCAAPTRARTPCRRRPCSVRRPAPGCGSSSPTRRPTRRPCTPSATQATARVNRSWERLGTLGPGDDETPSEARARVRTEMIREERAELLRIRDEGGGRPRGAHLGARPARRRGVGADLERHPRRRRARVAAAPTGPDRGRVRAPRRRRDPEGPDQRRGLPELPRRGADLGAPAARAPSAGRSAAATPRSASTPRRTSTRPATR